MKTQMNKEPSRDMANLMSDITDDAELIPKTGEYTHEMAEANAEDTEIGKEVGDHEIDKELPDSESGEIPYAKDFLIKKNTKRVQFWVDYFTKKNRDRFQRFINNGEEYRHHIEDVFVQYGLPKELYYVGLIESGYYLGAKSHASAVGPWQFIRGTGSRYGMKITSEIDERQDLFKATHGAAQYFRDLHNIFSSWELALAAYNAGENGIIRRIMKHGTRDFYQMSKNKQLPSETINYVPKVLAAMHVIKNAKKYGFHIPHKKIRLFDRTELRAVQKNVPLSTIAKRLNVDIKLLKKLNPEIRTNRTPRHFAGSYKIRIPSNRYSYKLDSIAAPAHKDVPLVAKAPREPTRTTANVTSHRVTRGETLISISRKYGTTPKRLAEMNNFRSWKYRVKIGQVLKLEQTKTRPTSKMRAVAAAPATPKVKISKSPITYKVGKGDNLTDIAKLFNTGISDIKNKNNLKRSKIFVGQKIVIPNTKKAIYTVRPGDNLTKVSKDFNLPIEAIMKINSMKRAHLNAGQKLIVNID